MSRGQDVLALMRGLQKVAKEVVRIQEKDVSRKWANSSVRSSISSSNDNAMGAASLEKGVSSMVEGASSVFGSVQTKITETSDMLKTGQMPPSPFQDTQSPPTSRTGKQNANANTAPVQEELDEEFLAAEAWLKQETEMMKTKNKAKEKTESSELVKPIQSKEAINEIHDHAQRDHLSTSFLSNLEPPPGSIVGDRPTVQHPIPGQPLHQHAKQSDVLNQAIKAAARPNVKPLSKEVKSTLSDTARERRVPGTRLGRIFSFGSLGLGLGAGTVAELTRRGLGLAGNNDDQGAILGKSPLLNKANAERIVSTLCRVRGAALKLGQMLSIQDNSFISPELQEIFERVRQSADFMPAWQMERVLNKELGSDWRSKVASFDDKPFAAASIGQVHRAVLHDGRTVAMKIQYPGVAESINSDIDNLMGIMKFINILPEGLYADKAMDVARRELTWECDYLREAKCSHVFREHLKNDSAFYIPEVIPDLTTKHVLTTELVNGVALDKLADIDQSIKDNIGKNLLKLTLEEVFIYNFMQTDPNWSNFLYDAETDKIILLDFGASREFSNEFTDNYIRVIKAAADNDRQGVLDYSVKLAFLTGYESKVLKTAHVDAVMILGEAFANPEPFNFGTQTTAARIHKLIPVMMNHRLTPPPEETYSLHRKMAGAFLLCNKLHSTIRCKPLFDDIYRRYQYGDEKHVDLDSIII